MDSSHATETTPPTERISPLESPPEPPLWRRTMAELQRRRVLRAAATYAAAAFVAVQAAGAVVEPLGLPRWLLTWTVLAAIVGFPVALVFAWFFDITGSGVARDRSTAGGAGRVFALCVALLTVGGLAYGLSRIFYERDDTPRATVGSEAPENSIAVLPFDDMSPQRDQGYLADGIAEELLDRLSRIDGLRVAARTSSFAMREAKAGIPEIARALNVRYVLEGSLRKASGRFRVTAQLIDAASGFHLWSETYEKAEADLFALQDQVTAAIAQQLRQRVMGIGAVRAEAESAPPTNNSAALQKYLEGRQAWRRRTPESLGEAERLFLEAVELDPNLARAWSGLSDSYLLQSEYGTRANNEAIALAEPAAVRAITLDTGSGEAWASLGLLRMSAGQIAAARKSFEEAIRLDPRYEMAPMWLSGLHARSGEVAKAREVLQKAIKLNPLEPVINVNLAVQLAEAGDAVAAIALLDRVLAITPNDTLLLRTRAQIQIGCGSLTEGSADARLAYQLQPKSPPNQHVLIEALLALEAFDRAARIAEQLPEADSVRAAAFLDIELQRGGNAVSAELLARVGQWKDHRGQFTGAQIYLLTQVGFAHLRGGRTESALEALMLATGAGDEITEDIKRLNAASLLWLALRKAGRAKEAESLGLRMSRAAERWTTSADPERDNPSSSFTSAITALQKGDRKAALAALERAYAQGFRQRWILQYDPRLASLNDAPELQVLIDRIGVDIGRAQSDLAVMDP